MGLPEHVVRAKIEKLLYENWEKSFRIIRPFSGLKEVLDQLRSDGYILGVMSDFPVQNKLKYLGLEGWDCSFTSEQTNYLKPHPEPFLELARRMKLDPAEILYVGNSFSKDIKGASAVGMKTAYLYSGKKKADSADFTFTDYRRLYEYVKNIDNNKKLVEDVT